MKNSNEETLDGIFAEIEQLIQMNMHFMSQIDLTNIDIMIFKVIWKLLPNMLQMLTFQVLQ